MNRAVYFDNNGTTALNPKVLQAMLPYLSQQQGNATSRHIFGRAARNAVDQAREQVADAVGAHPSQVIFTGGGTEADNLAITGVANALGSGKIAISNIEHPAVSRPALALKWQGWAVEQIATNQYGQVEKNTLETVLQKQVDMVSIMLANNETGVIQDIAALGEIARQHKVYMHTDAVQALGKIPVDFADLNVHAMTLSSHKINGPQGAGALILDKRIDIRPVLYGGGQEKGLRSGSENIAAIVGFGAACQLIAAEQPARHAALLGLRQRLEQGLSTLGAVIFASDAERLPNTSFFAFDGIEGETLVMALDRQGFAVASGSACSSDSTEPSHVLLAMGVQPDLARGAIRVSLGNDNDIHEVDAFLQALEIELSRLRKLTAVAI
ncbi:cysteine desulfurase [Methylobacillus rhizosphaerae]|uniref:cysteine desulfurase n=1 Tax=Methylobacillus rhizosphaerae TaxID=551994 RepID=A0A238Z0R1_9PROT|nr:cysteine desulfurase family protein [Methylobacillus rhizosphaerae]SNR76862.1 cysteine desulfurase [Methylobacillus rhizosphaerae]